MRQKLSETTITKNYLDTVLNSLSDSVIVTSPDGLIKSCNEATQACSATREADLVGKSLASFVDEAHRSAFDLATARRPRRARPCCAPPAGQTIPGVHGVLEHRLCRTRSSRAISTSRATSPSASAPSGAYAISRATTRLTKMPNRMQFQHLLQQAIARSRRNQHSLALLYLDLDRFKDVNDTFGHSAGDRTLEILSERLTRVLSKETVIGRLAGR